MRLPLKVAAAIRARKLLPPGARVLVALSGGPDSVALLLCLLELARKRDLAFTVAAAHLHHGLRGRAAERDLEFCRRLCARLGVALLTARCPVRKLARHLGRSIEETGRLVRRAFLSEAAVRLHGAHVAVAHHADDRIETVLYRLCRGTGLAGLVGIGWTGTLDLEGEGRLGRWLEWPADALPAPECVAPPERVVRPMLGCQRAEIVAYLRARRQRACRDETNFDTRIPRNALRHLVLPVLERKVHPGVRAALWRLAEEAEFHSERSAWRRGWLEGLARLGQRGCLVLPVARGGVLPSGEELAGVLAVLKSLWDVPALEVNAQAVAKLRELFGPDGRARRLELPGGAVAERSERVVRLRPPKARHTSGGEYRVRAGE